jgi:hypothetical protein
MGNCIVKTKNYKPEIDKAKFCKTCKLIPVLPLLTIYHS